jgi:hypothetical protein
VVTQSRVTPRPRATSPIRHSVDYQNNIVDVQRGVNGTTPATHAAGAGLQSVTDQRGVVRSLPLSIGAFQGTPTSSPGSSLGGGQIPPVLLGGSIADTEAVDVVDALLALQDPFAGQTFADALGHWRREG